MLAAIVAFTGPELRVRLAVQNVAGAHKRFAQPELIVSRIPRKICKARIVPCVRLNHHFCFIQALSVACSALSQLLTKMNSP